MEKVLKPYDKEYMRMAMLKHEETFREQVYELHRLYRIQKILMNTPGINHHHHQQQQQQSQQQHSQQRQKHEKHLVSEAEKPAFTINHQQLQHHAQIRTNATTTNGNKSQPIINAMGLDPPRPPREHIAESNTNTNTNNTTSLLINESEIELTLSLGPSVYNNSGRRKTRNKSESGQSMSSSSTGSSQTRKTSPKNSTTTTTTNGSTIMRSGDNNHHFTWGNGGFPQGSESEQGFSNGQQTNPPWLFQALSLKLT